jgi:hypothetical protein
MASEYKRIFIAKSIYAVLIGFLLFSSIHGLYNLKNDIWRYKWYNTKRIEFLQKYTTDGDVVIFQDNRLMEHAGPLFFERIYLVSDGEKELTRVFRTLKTRGINHCYFWTFDPDCFSQKWNDETIRIISRHEFEGGSYLFKINME